MMDYILEGLLWQSAACYLDDNLVYSKTWKEHLCHLREVFYRYRCAGLKLNLEKCSFGFAEIEALGHRLNSEGILVDPKKIEKMKEIPPPTTITQLRAALGLFGYYRRFINNYARIAKPLTSLLRKTQEYAWTTECQQAFDTLKEKLVQSPILLRPNYSKRFKLYTDASYHGIAAILAQENDDGLEGVITYASRTLTKAEQNYSASEIECLAIVWAFDQFEPYLYGNQFDLYSDHKALQSILNTGKTGNKRIARWLITLGSLDYKIHYKPGKAIPHVDGLSRLAY